MSKVILQCYKEDGTAITFNFDGNRNLQKMLEQYVDFLRAIGFGIENAEFDAITLGWQNCE